MDESKLIRKFCNFSSISVDSYWQTREGLEVKYAHILPGQTWQVSTFKNHEWKIRQTEGGVQVCFQEVIEKDDYYVCVVQEPTKIQYSLSQMLHFNAFQGTSTANSLDFSNIKEILDKILLNIIQNPKELKYRKLPFHNTKIDSFIMKPRAVLDFLLTIGFEKNSAQDALELSLPVTPLELEMQINDLKKAGQLLLDEVLAASKRKSQPLQSDKNDLNLECSNCKKLINDGSQNLNDSWLLNQGEFRYECTECETIYCCDCFDNWRSGKLKKPQTKQLHHICTFKTIAPKSRLWDHARNGPMPQPPQPNNKNMSKFWGY